MSLGIAKEGVDKASQRLVSPFRMLDKGSKNLARQKGREHCGYRRAVTLRARQPSSTIGRTDGINDSSSSSSSSGDSGDGKLESCRNESGVGGWT
ncbi:hypothetical protein M0802_006233 [Mischocyttarus mexicanus]|nr:hypothetical protein M0802_006233 [Mischocyttarus mexicanus]